jgi:hypothetical protein
MYYCINFASSNISIVLEFRYLVHRNRTLRKSDSNSQSNAAVHNQWSGPFRVYFKIYLIEESVPQISILLWHWNRRNKKGELGTIQLLSTIIELFGVLNLLGWPASWLLNLPVLVSVVWVQRRRVVVGWTVKKYLLYHTPSVLLSCRMYFAFRCHADRIEHHMCYHKYLKFYTSSQ